MVYARGEVEWLALNSGYYQWQLLDTSDEMKVRIHGIILIAFKSNTSLFN